MLAADGNDLDRLADALRVDGVVVDRVMGSGEAEESHDRLVELVRNVPFPVYVALVKLPGEVTTGRFGDANEALATLLHRRIGGKGVYVVGSDQGPLRIVTHGLEGSTARFSLSNSANYKLVQEAANQTAGEYLRVPDVVEAEVTVREAEALAEIATQDNYGDYPPTLSDAEVEELANRAVSLQSRAGWFGSRAYVPVRPASTGTSALLAVLAGSTVALFLGQTLRGWPGRRSSRGAGPTTRQVGAGGPDPAQEAARAEAALDVLVRRLERAAGDRSLDADLYGSALAAREAAERYVGSRDEVEVAGLRALVRTGERDLARSRGGRQGAYRPCFFDPRHAEATAEAGWRLGQGEVRVPCCRRCAKDVAAGRAPEALTVRRRGREVPYYTADDVWARTGFGSLTDTFARDVLRDGRRP